MKRWRLVVTELSGGAPVHEVAVEAANWMAALRAGRADMGEKGAVPTGASCAVAPDGKVTILDPIARRRYLLSPDEAKSLAKGKASGGPKVPADKRPDSVRPARGPRSKPPPGRKGATPGAKQATAAARPASTPPPAAAQPESTPPPAAAQPASTPPPAQEPRARNTVGYAVSDLPKEVREQIVGAPKATRSEPPPPSRATEPGQFDGPRAASPGAAQPGTHGFHELSRRDEEPTPQNPLSYRERSYVMPEGTPRAAAESMLRGRLRELEDELAGREKGKFVNLAVFDHEWRNRPARPPLATLEWKDWRDEVVVSFPLEELATRPTATPDKGPSGPRPSSDEDTRLAEAFEACQDLLFLERPVEGLEFVSKLLSELVPSEALTAALYDINTDELRFVHLTGPGADAMQGAAVKRRSGVMGAAQDRVGTPLRVGAPLAEHARFDPGVDGRPGLALRDAVYMPLHHQGRLMGMLQLLNSKGSAFDDADTEVVAYVGRQLAEFVHRSRLTPQRAHG